MKIGENGHTVDMADTHEEEEAIIRKPRYA
jgi:hypothetical protein